MLRAPFSSNTHANFPPVGEAVRSEGKGAEIACSIVKGAAGAAARISNAAAPNFQLQCITLSLVHWRVSMRTNLFLLSLLWCALVPAKAAPPQTDRTAAIKADLAGQIDHMKDQAQIMVDTIF